MWYVYLLLCNQKTYYVGITNDVGSRLTQHKNKLSEHTSKYSDLSIVYCEKYTSKHEAAIREKQLKGWSRAKKQMLINGPLKDIHRTEVVEVLSDKG